MKKLLLIASLALLSCSRDCDEAREQIKKEYEQALTFAVTPEAKQEITRQFNDRYNQLDCD